MRIRWPSIIQVVLIKIYCCLTGAKPSEAELPIKEYPSLASFFVRNLKPGLRPVQADLVSPVDGLLRTQGQLSAGRLEQIKGHDYSIADFLCEKNFQGLLAGYYMNFYLSPADYHHVHSPVSGKIVKTVSIPGGLLPVNDFILNKCENVFASNQRVAIYIQSQFGLVVLVMVGALNVGQISLSYDSLRTNHSFLRTEASVIVKNHVPELSIEAGQRLGTFNMGSSVVLLFENKPLITLNSGEKVNYGSKL